MAVTFHYKDCCPTDSFPFLSASSSFWQQR